MATRTKRFRLHLTDGDGRVIDSWDTDDSYNYEMLEAMTKHIQFREELDAILLSVKLRLWNLT